MTLKIETLRAILEGVEGYADKVVYYQWPINDAPALPFVCFFEQQAYTFPADNVVYYQRPRFSVELYTKNKDPQQEALFEAAFTAARLYYTKETEYLEDERCQITVFQL